MKQTLREIVIKETGEKILVPENKFSPYGKDAYKFVNIGNHLYHRAKHNEDYVLLVKDMYNFDRCV
jgi:hypothetical protein